MPPLNRSRPPRRGNCVEVMGAGTAVLVRDSKRRGEAFLPVGADEWAAFVRMAARLM
ncbi:DUF397 domain-containing protein [Streptomyces sp. NPDC001797]|uniref:DUF397 domain-containing protein n=2 Tax=unclassified Streptomyces TaxID=2593676 RepID=A0ABV1TGC1_9ACTN